MPVLRTCGVRGHCLSAASKSATRTSPHGAGLEPPAPAARRHETGDDAILDLDGAMAALQWGWRTRAGLRAAAYGSGRTRGSCGRNPPRLHPEVAACEVVGDGAAAVIRDSSSSLVLHVAAAPRTLPPVKRVRNLRGHVWPRLAPRLAASRRRRRRRSDQQAAASPRPLDRGHRAHMARKTPSTMRRSWLHGVDRAVGRCPGQG